MAGTRAVIRTGAFVGCVVVDGSSPEQKRRFDLDGELSRTHTAISIWNAISASTTVRYYMFSLMCGAMWKKGSKRCLSSGRG